MRLVYRMPHPRMRRFLTVHALLNDVAEELVDTVPAMLPNLHIRLAGSSNYRFGEGHEVGAPRVALIGPTTQAYSVRLAPGCVLLTTGFLPLGWMAMTQVAAGELRDTITDGADIWGASTVETLYDELLTSPSYAARCGLLERFLLAVLKPAEDARLSSTLRIDHWLETSPDLSIDGLARDLDICPRHLRRLTLETHGASPKTLAMKYRCLRAAAVLSLKGAAGVQDALPHYADQAHLIRDLRRFVGWTPARFVGGDQSVAASTLRGRRAAGASRPLSLLS